MTLSARARRLTGASSPLVDAHFRIAGDLYHPERHPAGYVNFGTSENHLLWDLLAPRLAGPRPIRPEDAHYHPFHGMADFRAAAARFFGRVHGAPVGADDLVLLGGAAAVLDALAYALCEPGEAVVVPAPYYPGLDDGLGGRAAARVVPAPLSSADGFALRPDAVEAACRQAASDGVRVRALALVSPANPLACTYDAATLNDVANVARRDGLHLIVDEMYAGSVFGPRPFTSGLHLPPDVLPPERVHLVWGFAKDFALSGFKAGVLHTRNEEVRAAVRQLAMLAPVSTDTQVLLRTLLTDDAWVDALRAENARRLAAACADTTGALAAHRVAARPADAGLFLWLDLRHALPEPTFRGEQALWRRLLDEARVLVSPGAVFHCAEPGWFRLCYATDRQTVHEGVDRLGRTAG